ncbi:TetR/AcrR family transcriptional regulator [Hyphobacterium sp.]|uniref:TetR/AcrR family transcriptional regulator n=1 Tax=Hyphobacterium sp. TaxID=2004662 RepID=UPI003B528E3F
MSEKMTGTGDRRVRKTRTAIVRAFSKLALSRPYKSIKVADIVEAADVGRSTFYEHFSGRDAVHLAALKRHIGILAMTVDAEPDVETLTHMIGHYWEYRALARNTFSGPQRTQVVALLAERIDARLPADTGTRDLVARQLAEGQAGLIRAWVSGEVTGRAEEIARHFCAVARATCNAVRLQRAS